MTRDKLIQSILDLFSQPRYLEIGVNRGITFHALKAEKKVAVDPIFQFNVVEAAKSNQNASYHQVTSNKYFSTEIDQNEKFDVIYLDGLHTFEQTLADFLNASLFLSDGGVIVIDDVIPNSYSASLPDHQACVQLRNALGKDLHDKSWMGDVYRLVFFLADYAHQFSYATAAENHGQLIAWREPRDMQGREMRSLEHISRLPFEASQFDRGVYNIRPLHRIIDMIKSARKSVAVDL